MVMNARTSGHTGRLPRVLTVVLAVCFGSGLGNAQEQAKAPMTERVQRTLDDFVRSSEAPGVTVAFSRGPTGEVVSLSSGLADREASTAMMPAARMPAGSVGKIFVAALALDLVAEQQLELDAPAKKWLGQRDWWRRVPGGDQITPRMLLSHTSGLSDHVSDVDFAAAVLARVESSADPDQAFSPEELLGFVLNDPPLGAPGESYHYSDTNYILIGLLLEQVTGRPFFDVLIERILLPLGLVATEPALSRTYDGLVAGYSPANPLGLPEKVADNGVMAFSPAMEWTGGGLVSTSADLARFLAALVAGEAPFGPERYVQMREGSPLGSEVGYGLGLSVSQTSMGPAVGHRGEFPGYTSVVRYFSDHDLVVAAQANSDRNVDLGGLATRLALELTGGGAAEVSPDRACRVDRSGDPLAGSWPVDMKSGSGQDLRARLELAPSEQGYEGTWQMGDSEVWEVVGTLDGDLLRLASVGEPSGGSAPPRARLKGIELEARLSGDLLRGLHYFLLEKGRADVSLQWTGDRSACREGNR